jgi:hypothetical protein
VDVTGLVVDYTFENGEFVRCSLNQGSQSYQIKLEKCLNLKMIKSPDIFEMVLIESLLKLKYLEIEQNIDT